MSFVLSATTLAQQNLGNLEQFVNQPVAYEDAGLNLFGDGSGDYSFETYNDATVSQVKKTSLFDSILIDVSLNFLFSFSTMNSSMTASKMPTQTFSCPAPFP